MFLLNGKIEYKKLWDAIKVLTGKTFIAPNVYINFKLQNWS